MNEGGTRSLYPLLLVVMCTKSNMENRVLHNLCPGTVPIKWTAMNYILNLR